MVHHFIFSRSWLTNETSFLSKNSEFCICVKLLHVTCSINKILAKFLWILIKKSFKITPNCASNCFLFSVIGVCWLFRNFSPHSSVFFIFLQGSWLYSVWAVRWPAAFLCQPDHAAVPHGWTRHGPVAGWYVAALPELSTGTAGQKSTAETVLAWPSGSPIYQGPCTRCRFGPAFSPYFFISCLLLSLYLTNFIIIG